MKKLLLFSLVFLLAAVLLVQDSRAEDYTRLNLPEGAILRLGRGKITGFTFSSDGLWLAVSSTTGIWLYNVHDGFPGALLQGDASYSLSESASPATSVLAAIRRRNTNAPSEALSPDGNTLASASDSTVVLRDVTTGKIKAKLKGHTDLVQAVTFSPDGTTLTSASYSEIRSWDAAAGENEATHTLEKSGSCCLELSNMAFSPDGMTLAGGDYERILLWDINTGELKKALEESDWSNNVTFVNFSPDGNTIASGAMDNFETIRLWDVNTSRFKDIGMAEHGSFAPLAFSSDGTSLLSQKISSSSRTYNGWRYFKTQAYNIGLWDVRTGKHMNTWRFSADGWGVSLTSVAFSQTAGILAIGRTVVERGGATFGSVTLKDMNTGQTRRLEHEAGVTFVSVSPDGTILFSRMDSVTADARHYEKTLRLWDVATGQLLASASEDSTVQLRDTTSGELKATLTRGTVTFASEGSTRNSASNRKIGIQDAATGELKAALKGDSVLVSPDGMTLAGASQDGTILLWDMANGANNTARKFEGDDESIDTAVSWCAPAQTVMVSFQLLKNGKTASICRQEAKSMVYSFGVLGDEPELEYRGPILGEISARGVLWGEGVSSLADLAVAVVDEGSTWFDPQIDAGAIAKAAKSRETSGFYTVNASTGMVSQGVYIFRTGGWEYAISSSEGRPVNVEEDELDDYRSHEISVLSPKGKMYRLR